jgi:hypothetical protein
MPARCGSGRSVRQDRGEVNHLPGRAAWTGAASVAGARGVNPPVRPVTQGSAPGGQAALAVVDFLAAAHEADDHWSVAAAAHDVQQVRRLGLRELDPAQDGFRDGVRGSPAALGLVDDDDPFGRHAGLCVGIAEGGEGLDHRLHPLPGCPERPAASVGGHAVPGKRFAEHVDERRVAGQERGAAAERRVQPAQCFASARHAGDEHDGRAPQRAGVGAGGIDGLADSAQTGGVGAGRGKVSHPVPGVERAGGFDEAGNRLVWRCDPAGRIEDGPGHGGEFAQQRPEALGISGQQWRDSGERQHAVRADAAGLCGDEQRHDGMLPAAGMEIVEVERCVFGRLAVPVMLPLPQGAGDDAAGHQHDGVDRPRRPQQPQLADPEPTPALVATNRHRRRNQLPCRPGPSAKHGAAYERGVNAELTVGRDSRFSAHPGGTILDFAMLQPPCAAPAMPMTSSRPVSNPSPW